MCLDFCHPAQPHHIKPPELSTVATPLKVQAWQKEFSGRPDQALARYICSSGDKAPSQAAEASASKIKIKVQTSSSLYVSLSDCKQPDSKQPDYQLST